MHLQHTQTVEVGWFMCLFDINYLNEQKREYMMTENFEVLTPEFGWTEVVTKGGKNYFIEGYISTIDKDDYNEVVTMQAQEKLLKACQDRMASGKAITMDLEHEEFLDEFGRPMRKPKGGLVPVAKIVQAEMRDRGVWVKAEINKDSERFPTVWKSIKEGFLHSFSIAFAPLKAVSRKVNGVTHKLIEDLNLLNVTLTGAPVNREATFNVALKAKLRGEENMSEENKNETPKEEEGKQEKPVEETQSEDNKQDDEEGKEEEKTLTVNDLVENAKALEKEKAEFEAQKKKFEEEKKAFEDSQKKEEPKEKDSNDLISQIKAKDQEITDLKAKLNAPILKSKITSPDEVSKKGNEKKFSMLEQI